MQLDGDLGVVSARRQLLAEQLAFEENKLEAACVEREHTLRSDAKVRFAAYYYST